MEKREKWIWLTGSLAVGIIAVLIVILCLSAFGVLEGSAPPLTIASGSADFVYDGTEHTCKTWELKKGTLKDGHTIEVEFTGARTDAGASDNTFIARIKDGRGADVTRSYTVEEVYGTITIKPRPVSIATVSGTKVYDGKPLFCPGWEFASESALLQGHGVEKIVMPAQRTDVGVTENYVSEIVVTDGARDVTSNYAFTYFPGEITVTPRNLTIRSASASKNYDGTPLTDGTWERVSATGPVTGHRLDVTVSGTRTEVGESENTVSEVLVFDANGKDVTFNYAVTLQTGSLVVKGGSSGTGPGAGGPNLNDDGMIGAGGSDPSSQGEPALRVLTDLGGRVYLRLTSFGGYNGRGWEEAASSGMLLDDAYGMNYLTGIALKEAGYVSTKMRVEALCSDYLLPYYLDTDLLSHTAQTDDVRYRGDTSLPYALYYYSYDVLSDGILSVGLGEYAAAEKEYAAFVKQNYLAVPASTRTVLNGIIEEMGFDPESENVVAEVAEYIRGAAPYDEEYDKTIDQQTDIVAAFLGGYGAGVCRHFASAAVLLYRALGIPARYTIGYAADVSSGAWTEIGAESAHAWAEVYIEGTGWVHVEVTGAGAGGTGGGGEALDIRPVTEYMKYDGVTTLYPSGKVQGLSDLLERGYRYEVQIAGSRRDAGITVTRITSFRLFSVSGADVTDTFRIRFSTGKLQVYLQEIGIKTMGAKRMYDGTPLTESGCEIEGKLLYGHTVKTLAATGSLTETGRCNNPFSVRIEDGNGKNVTDVYKINAEYGVLEVLPREIEFTAMSGEKVYDGTPLTAPHYYVTAGELAAGHRAEVTVAGSQTAIGRCDNRIVSVSIFDAEGRDVTKNYAVGQVSGTLTVKADR